jgi:hypothetical protein
MIFTILYGIFVALIMGYLSYTFQKLYNREKALIKDNFKLLEEVAVLEQRIRDRELIQKSNVEHKILIDLLSEGNKKPKTLITKLEKKYGVKLSYKEDTMFIEFNKPL